MKSDQACLLFLVTFYDYPAPSIVNKEKKEKQISDEKFSAVLSEQTQKHQKKEKQNSDEKFLAVLSKQTRSHQKKEKRK